MGKFISAHEHFEPEIFAHNLRVRRESLGMTREQLAAVAGVGYRSVITYETGEHLPKIDAACWMAKALGVSLDQLCGAQRKEQKAR